MKLFKFFIIILANSCLLMTLLSIFAFCSTMNSFEKNSEYSVKLKDYAKALYIQIKEERNDE